MSGRTGAYERIGLPEVRRGLPPRSRREATGAAGSSAGSRPCYAEDADTQMVIGQSHEHLPALPVAGVHPAAGVLPVSGVRPAAGILPFHGSGPCRGPVAPLRMVLRRALRERCSQVPEGSPLHTGQPLHGVRFRPAGLAAAPAQCGKYHRSALRRQGLLRTLTRMAGSGTGAGGCRPRSPERSAPGRPTGRLAA